MAKKIKIDEVKKEIIAQMYKKNESVEGIARKLKVSGNAISYHLEKMGLRKIKKQTSPWSKEEEDFLKENENMPAKEIAEKLGRTTSSITAKRYCMAPGNSNIETGFKMPEEPNHNLKIGKTYKVIELKTDNSVPAVSKKSPLAFTLIGETEREYVLKSVKAGYQTNVSK